MHLMQDWVGVNGELVLAGGLAEPNELFEVLVIVVIASHCPLVKRNKRLCCIHCQLLEHSCPWYHFPAPVLL